MGIVLTEVQKELLGNPNKVKALARWVIESSSNTYARRLCDVLVVPQGNSPTDKQVARISAYLTEPTADRGIVVRLINHYRNTRRS